MPSSRVTLADVARAAGVSRTTASFVLSGRTDMRISADAQQRVLAAAAELGYRPNLTARSLRRGTSRTIGLVSDTIATSPYAGEVIHGALDTALAHHHLLFVVETGEDAEVERTLVDQLLDRQVDALIYASMFTRHRTLPPALTGRRVVLLNCLTDGAPAPAVIPDERAAGATAAQAVLEQGHRDGIYLLGETPDSVFAARERREGIDAALAAAGVGLAGQVDCQWWPESGYEGVRELTAAGRLPTALICLNDRIAFGAYQALEEARLRIPEDVSVVSFDDSDLASWVRPQLTSIALPHYELGARAVRLVLDETTGPAVARVPMPLRRRPSLGPPPRRAA